MKIICSSVIVCIMICSCAELMREFTSIEYNRNMFIVNDLNDSISIRITDSICCNPDYNAKYILGFKYYNPNVLKLNINEGKKVEYRIDNTIEYDKESAIDTFNIVNTNYRKICLKINKNEISTEILIPWKSDGWKINELPNDANSTDKIEIICSDTIMLSKYMQ